MSILERTWRSLAERWRNIQAQHQIRTWFHTGRHPELSQRWFHLLAILGEDIYGDPHRPTIERIDIATYPETITLIKLLASQHWRERDDLLTEAGRRLGVRLHEQRDTALRAPSACNMIAAHISLASQGICHSAGQLYAGAKSSLRTDSRRMRTDRVVQHCMRSRKVG
ncbi:hypothetical protein ACWDKQ_31745 [Saccharopolyspora sp. NPDC000995]